MISDKADPGGRRIRGWPAAGGTTPPARCRLGWPRRAGGSAPGPAAATWRPGQPRPRHRGPRILGLQGSYYFAVNDSDIALYCVHSFYLEMLNLIMDLLQVDQKSRMTFITKQAAGD